MKHSSDALQYIIQNVQYTIKNIKYLRNHENGRQQGRKAGRKETNWQSRILYLA